MLESKANRSSGNYFRILIVTGRNSMYFLYHACVSRKAWVTLLKLFLMCVFYLRIRMKKAPSTWSVVIDMKLIVGLKLQCPNTKYIFGKHE